jgi:hypothetical protein
MSWLGGGTSPNVMGVGIGMRGIKGASGSEREREMQREE